MSNPVDQLKERIIGNKIHTKKSGLTDILDMARMFGCIGDIMGRDFEVRDPQGKLLYKIRQISLSVKQLNTLLREWDTLRHMDVEAENAKWGGRKGKRASKSRKR